MFHHSGPRTPRPHRFTATTATIALRFAVVAVVLMTATAACAPVGSSPVDPDRRPGEPSMQPPEPASMSMCRERAQMSCFGAGELAHLYGLDRARQAGLDGRGETVAIVMPYHDPHLSQALDAYSRMYNLDSADLVQVPNGGKVTGVPADEVAAGVEVEIDAQMVHVAAPKARIMVVEVPGPWQTISDLGRAINAAAWAARVHRVAAVSFTYGWAENDYPPTVLARQNTVLRAATQAGASLFAAAGDAGPTATTTTGGQTRYRGVDMPPASPYVTAVAGTEPHTDLTGTRTGPDTVANDSASHAWPHGLDLRAGAGAPGVATGGGISRRVPRPAWQAARLGDHRSVGDISLIGSNTTPVWANTRYDDGSPSGWHLYGGTSIATPLMAGITADAAQAAGHRLGDINPTLYRLHGTADGITDITTGCNTYAGVTGYCAHPGPDTPSGVGTVSDASLLIPALAAAVR